MTELDQFYENQSAEIREVFLALRNMILKSDKKLTPEWKYRLPFFYYKGKMFCYLWFHKKYKQPYIGFVAGSVLNDEDLLLEKRARMKILLIDPNKDLPKEKINILLDKLLNFYKKELG